MFKRRRCFRFSVEPTLRRSNDPRRALLRLRPLQGVTLAARRGLPCARHVGFRPLPWSFRSLRRLSTSSSGTALSHRYPRPPSGFLTLSATRLDGTSGHFQTGNALGISLFRGLPPRLGPPTHRRRVALLAFYLDPPRWPNPGIIEAPRVAACYAHEALRAFRALLQPWIRTRRDLVKHRASRSPLELLPL